MDYLTLFLIEVFGGAAAAAVHDWRKGHDLVDSGLDGLLGGAVCGVVSCAVIVAMASLRS